METPQSSFRSRSSSIGANEAPFHAPMSTFDEIVDAIKQIGFPDITIEDLQGTRKEKIRSVYSFLLEICGGVTEEELEKRAVAYRSKCQEHYKFDFAETLHASFVDFLFFVEIRSIVVASGYEKFTMRDIHTPTPSRLRVILSHIINFCKFREQQIPVYTKLMESRNKLVDYYDGLVQEKQGLLEQREIALEEASQRADEAENLRQRCAEMEVLYMEMMSQQSNDRKMGTEAKKAAQEIRDKTEIARWEVEAILTKINELEASARVHSPERKIKLCEERKRALEAIKKEHVELCGQIETVSALTHQAQSYQQPLEDILNLTSQLVNTQEKIRVCKAEEAEIQGTIRDVDGQFLEVQKTIEQEERTLARLEYQLKQSSQDQDDLLEDEYRRKRKEALEKEVLAKQRYDDVARAYKEMLAKQKPELEAMDKVEAEMVEAFCKRLGTIGEAFEAKQPQLDT
jgi:Nuf2 family